MHKKYVGVAKLLVQISLIAFVILLVIIIPMINAATTASSTGGHVLTKEPFSTQSATCLNKTNTPTLLNEYPYSGRTSLANTSYENMWHERPIGQAGSYAQETNNWRYWPSPDDGTCSRAEFCGSFYDKIEVPDNKTQILPPVPDGPGVRIGYTRANHTCV